MDKSLTEQSPEEVERLFVNDVSVRTTVALKVKDSEVQKLLPKGWDLAALEAGPTKGSNLSVVLIDPVIIQDQQGALVAPQATFVIATLARQVESNLAVPMVIGGFSISAPGAYEVYQSAKLTVERHSKKDATGLTTLQECWRAESERREVFEVRSEFVRGSPVRTNFDTKVYSAARPDFFRIYRGEQ